MPGTPGAERLRVGECLVDVALREIHAPGGRRPRRVTPKAIAVLLALAAQPGRVVGRDALLARVWPDTMPTDDVLTQAVTQLRKAFGGQRGAASGSADAPRYIETIAKTGYRLLAPVEWLGDPSPPPPSSPPPPPAGGGDTGHEAPGGPSAPPAAAPAVAATPAGNAAGEAVPAGRADGATPGRHGWPVLAAAALLLVLAGLVLWIVLAGKGGAERSSTGAWVPRNERPFRLITSRPGFEQAPTLSPDAAMVAYVARPSDSLHSVIMVQTTGQSRARELTRPPPGFDDSSPEWSPDGREIAFLRIRHDGECRVMVMPAATGGGERTVAGCDPRSPPSFDWKPDGSALLFGANADAPGEVGLRELDLASGNWRSLLYTYRRDDVDAAPRYSPDGRWIVFVRNSPLGDFWRIPAGGGEAERLSDLRADILGWDWGPDADSLLFATRTDGDTRLYRLELGDPQPRDLGIADALSPATVPGSRALAFVQSKPYFGLRQVEREAPEEGLPESRRLFASTGRDVMPAMAPDGQQLVFLSDRSGPNGLWWARLGEPDSLRHLEGVRPDARHAPEWAADSRRLLVSGSVAGGPPGIFEVVPASGQVSRLPIPIGDPLQAAYLPDPARVLVVAGALAGRPRLILFDRSTPVWQPLAALDDVSRVQVDHAGRRLLFTRHSRGGLWQAALDLDPASVRQVSPLPNAANYRMWEVDDRGRVVFIEQREECATWLQPATEGLPGRCLYAAQRSSRLGFALAPRNGPIFITPAVYDNADIGFMELPPARKSFVPGWIK